MKDMEASAAPGDVSPCAGMTTFAPASASAKLKDMADFVCDGKDDQIELRASIKAASRLLVRVDKDLATQRTVVCHGCHSVLWLSGDYQLDETLVIPDAADVVIGARGSYFHYGPPEDSVPGGSDAIIVQGMSVAAMSLARFRATPLAPRCAFCPRKACPV